MQSVGIEMLQVLPSCRAAPGMYAGFWRRVVAWSIDALLVGALDALLTISFGTWLLVPWAVLGGHHGPMTAKLVDIGLQPLGVVVAWLYYGVCESSRWQATVGKLVLGLRVTDECGGRIGFARATGRYFGKIASALFLCVGFLLAGWTARKQALHDLMAGCCVVRRGGLDAWVRQHSVRSEPAVTATVHGLSIGMPGWAIALVVIAGGFLVFPMLVMIAAVAIPVYRNYMVRAEVSQGITLTERPRALIAEYIGVRGALPGNNAALGLPRPEAIQTRYVTSVGVDGGKVVVTYGNQADRVIRGGHVVVAPYGNAKLLHWQCSSRDIEPRYLPPHCRD